MEVLIATQFVILQVNSFCCIDRQVEFTMGTTPLLGSTPYEPTVKGLESMEDDYSKPITNTLIKTMEFYHDIMRNKIALCIHVTPNPHTHD